MVDALEGSHVVEYGKSKRNAADASSLVCISIKNDSGKEELYISIVQLLALSGHFQITNCSFRKGEAIEAFSSHPAALALWTKAAPLLDS